MNLKKLSITNRIDLITEFIIEWFMNLFADPDLYWTLETYPNAKEQRKIITDLHVVSPKKARGTYSLGVVKHLLEKLRIKVLYTVVIVFLYQIFNCTHIYFYAGIKEILFFTQLLKAKSNINFRIKIPVFS